MSGRSVGKTIVSLRVFFTSANPAISSHLTFGSESRIESYRVRTISGSIFDFAGSLDSSFGYPAPALAPAPG